MKNEGVAQQSQQGQVPCLPGPVSLYLYLSEDRQADLHHLEDDENLGGE
jgi:hypothetical protein